MDAAKAAIGTWAIKEIRGELEANFISLTDGSEANFCRDNGLTIDNGAMVKDRKITKKLTFEIERYSPNRAACA